MSHELRWTVGAGRNCFKRSAYEVGTASESRTILQSEEVGGLPEICFCRSSLVR